MFPGGVSGATPTAGMPAAESGVVARPVCNFLWRDGHLHTADCGVSPVDPARDFSRSGETARTVLPAFSRVRK